MLKITVLTSYQKRFMLQYSVSWGEFKNEKKKGKTIYFPMQTFEPQNKIFSQHFLFTYVNPKQNLVIFWVSWWQNEGL